MRMKAVAQNCGLIASLVQQQSNLDTNEFGFLIHIHFVVCKCFKFGLVKNFVIRLKVNPLPNNATF